MSIQQAVLRLGKLPLLALLAQPELRRRIIFELTHNHYFELEVAVPLGGKLTCPVTNPDHWYSFSEIFLAGGEYSSVFEKIAPPQRWIDLGCHAGYFSLFVAWLRERRHLSSDFQCLLLDADPRVEGAVNKLIALNGLDNKMLFKKGVIAAGEGERKFSTRPVMASSVATNEESDSSALTSVAILTQTDISALLPPPYDLIKIDIEGMEHDFLMAYDQLVLPSKYLLLEWHSWHSGGGGADQIRTMVEMKGFELIDEPVLPHAVQGDGDTGQCGVFLFANRR